MADLNSLASLLLLTFLITLLFGNPFPLLAGLALFLTGLFSDRAGAFISQIFRLLADTVTGLITGLLLSVVFYVILTPLALVRRLLVKDSSAAGKQPDTEFINRQKLFTMEDFEKPW